MAYAATILSRRTTVERGRRHVTVTVRETEAATASEFTIPGLPPKGKIVSYKATKVAGTGATINPRLGLATGFMDNTQNHLATNSTTAAHINDQVQLRYQTVDEAGELFVNSNVDAAADNTIDTEIMVAEGWE